MAIHVGTSGWHYAHWRGRFYPREVPARAWLAYYAERFAAVEVNGSFYKLPTKETLASWRETVPAGFVFAAKASRYITHMKKLKDPQASVARFFEHIEALGDRLGPILFQLPPRWGYDGERLAAFLEVLPKQHRYAFEFRDPSWQNAEAYRLLEQHGAALCLYDLAGYQSPLVVTSGLVYVRLHGPGAAYQGSYSDRALEAWAERLRGWGGEVHCYFDNDQAAHAIRDAERLRGLLGP